MIPVIWSDYDHPYLGFRYACGWNKFTLEIMGLWPRRKTTYFGRNRALIHAFVIFVVITIPRLVGAFFFRHEIDALIQCLGTYLPFIIGIVKLITLHYRREVLAEFLETMESDWAVPLSGERLKVMLEMAIIGRRISIFSGSMAYTANSIGIVVQKWYNLEAQQIQDPDPRLVTNLFWIVWLPYDTTNGINYAVSFVLQLYSSVYAALFYFIFDSFIVMLVLHLCGQLGGLQVSLRHLHETDVHKVTFQTKLRNIVRKHEKLVRLAGDLEESFNFVLLLQLLGCTLMFCFQGYGIIRLVTQGTLNLFQVGFAVTVVFATAVHFFFCCWAGEFLVSQSVSVGYAVYNCEWYKLPHLEARSLILIGLSKLRPLELTAGKFSVLSFNLFLNVLKTSMSYLSMLLAVQGRE
ncbi:putative odorant receptor 85e [Diachasma alloeum]|uniref:Odorant receptor n=1 Tax=Diachasma alloeum TaxID=454923 RepID=A0A4E0RQX7_9HYME|nr:putative odorant receptor 85e [Diachasma alloeum]THK33244.1 odorant receptor 26 [Diachasma alloeum]